MTDPEDDQEPREEHRGSKRMMDDDQKWDDLDEDEESFLRDVYDEP